MMRITAVVALFSPLTEAELQEWVERGWVRPERAGGEPVFHDIDVARISLIHDLRVAMRVEDDTIPIILSLLDQVHDLRAGLHAVLRAVDAQPTSVRASILAAIG